MQITDFSPGVLFSYYNPDNKSFSTRDDIFKTLEVNVKTSHVLARRFISDDFSENLHVMDFVINVLTRDYFKISSGNKQYIEPKQVEHRLSLITKIGP